MATPMPPVMDYVGPFGGAMWSAFAAGAVAASTLLVSTGAVIWRMFGDTRIKALEAQIAQERARCDEEIAELRRQIVQLQTVLISSGPAALRNAVQAIVVVAGDDEKGLGK